MEFRLLGPVEAVSGGRAVPLKGSKCALLLAALLLAEGELVTTERLIEILTAEEPAEKLDKRNPRDNLQSNIRHLKDQLKAAEEGMEKRIPLREPGYRLHVGQDDVDLRRFRAKAEKMAALARQDLDGNAAEIARLGRTALQEWGEADREPLANLSGPWAEGHRERLRGERRKVQAAYWEAEVLSGNGAHLVQELRKYSNAEPFDERRLRLLMRAYDQAGTPTKAIDCYRALTRNLKEKYGRREPEKETKELLELITMPNDESAEPPGQTTNFGATFQQPFTISDSASVQGLVFGGQNVTLHFGDQNSGALVPVPETEAVPDGWQGSADVTVGDHTYLLHTPYLDERRSGDQAVIYREARALRREPVPEGRGPEYVWLRQVGLRVDTPEGREAVKALFDEHGLLTGLGPVPGLPRPVREPWKGPDGTATLIVGWPSSPSDRTPCPGLDTMIDPGGGPMDPFQMYGLLQGLAGLCEALTRLHQRGVAHRALTPAAIIALDRGRLTLRDLGLAARPFRTGEGASGHQAPEQRTGAGRAAGPHTDVYRLAAVAYHLLSGGPPDARAALPVAGQVPGLPDWLGRTLDAALAADPAERPGMAALGAGFRIARKALPR